MLRPPGLSRVKSPLVLDVVQGRAVEIGAATDEERHRLRDRLEDFAPGFARRELGVGGESRHFSRRSAGLSYRLRRRAPPPYRGGPCATPPSRFPFVVSREELLLVLGEVFLHVIGDVVMLLR